MGCCGPIPFEWAVEHGYVNGKMTRAEMVKRHERWNKYAVDDGNRPEVQIDHNGNIFGVDGILTSGWRATYVSHLLEDNMIKVKGEGRFGMDHYKRVG